MSSGADVKNPFPGPQPYRAADRDRFFGRDVMVKKLSAQILARTATTLHGPSGAGKSSLMQAGVIPRLIETHDFQVVRVDGWPMGEAPLPWLLRALYAELELGDAPGEVFGPEAVDEAMALAERRSEQPILIYLDQMEQLLFPERPLADAEALIAAVDRLSRAPIQGLQIVLSLREDYLGRFRDRARDRRDLIAFGFRLGPLTVAEMASAVCKAAIRGKPPQMWDERQMLDLMRDVRTPGQADTEGAEVQAAYAQIVCRALFQQNAGNRVQFDDTSSAPFSLANLGVQEARGKLDTEAILRLYLDATVASLGDLRGDAWKLLEDHLITNDGSRTLRTETELLRLVPPERLGPILKTLEGAAILHAEAHQGSRYFEIGHDWLARRVHEQRHVREQAEALRRKQEAEAEALAKEREEAAARLAKVRRQRRFLAFVALASIAVATGAGALGLWALREQKRAEKASDSARLAEVAARAKAVEASDARLMAGYRELRSGGDYANGMKLLHEVQKPEQARGWIGLANEALLENSLEATLKGADEPFSMAAWSHDGKRIVGGTLDGTALVWSANGEGDPLELSMHDKSIVQVAWSPDDARILTASADGTAKIFRSDGKGIPIVFDPHVGPLRSASFSPDGTRIVIVAEENEIARVYTSEGGGLVEISGHGGALWSAEFMPDGAHLLTASGDKTARITSIDGSDGPVVFWGHNDTVRFAVPSPDGALIVTTSDDKTARIWPSDGKGAPAVLSGHTDSVIQAAWSPDGKRVATASLDKTGRIWPADGKGEPVVLQDPGVFIASVAFRPDGRYVLTHSSLLGIAIWPVSGGKPYKAFAHPAPAGAGWSPDGTRVLTAAGLAAPGIARDTTIKVFRPDPLNAWVHRQGPHFHAASLLPGGDRAVAAYDDMTARIFRLDGTGAPILLSGHEEWVTSAAASPDGLSILTTSFDKTARIWSADGKGQPLILRGAEAAVRAGAWSPDGKRVVTCSDDRKARIWRVDTGVVERELSGHTDILTGAAWSLDGAFVLTSSLDHTARISRADGTGQAIVLKGHGAGIDTAAFSPDGARVVTASADGTAGVWETKTGQLVFSIEGESSATAAIWSPDGRRIATGRGGELWLSSADGVGEPVKIACESILAMAFIDGGRRIVAIQEDDTTRTFTIDVEAVMVELEASNLDCLSEEKRSTYLGEEPTLAVERYAACERAAKRTPHVQGRAQ